MIKNLAVKYKCIIFISNLKTKIMYIKKFRHANVLADGRIIGGGSVETKGSIRMSSENGGCGLSGCHCSDGHWIMIASPRTDDGVVEGMTVKFDNYDEFKTFLEIRHLTCK